MTLSWNFACFWSYNMSFHNLGVMWRYIESEEKISQFFYLKENKIFCVHLKGLEHLAPLVLCLHLYLMVHLLKINCKCSAWLVATDQHEVYNCFFWIRIRTYSTDKKTYLLNWLPQTLIAASLCREASSWISFSQNLQNPRPDRILGPDISAVPPKLIPYRTSRAC